MLSNFHTIIVMTTQCRKLHRQFTNTALISTYFSPFGYIDTRKMLTILFLKKKNRNPFWCFVISYVCVQYAPTKREIMLHMNQKKKSTNELFVAHFILIFISLAGNKLSKIITCNDTRRARWIGAIILCKGIYSKPSALVCKEK